jgi:hypothetical protein
VGKIVFRNLERQQILCQTVNPENSEQLPHVRPLSLVSDREQHPLFRVVHVEGVIHPFQNLPLRHATLPAIVKHGVGFPIAVLKIMGDIILELESKFEWRGVEGR